MNLPTKLSNELEIIIKLLCIWKAFQVTKKGRVLFICLRTIKVFAWNINSNIHFQSFKNNFLFWKCLANVSKTDFSSWNISFHLKRKGTLKHLFNKSKHFSWIKLFWVDSTFFSLISLQFLNHKLHFNPRYYYVSTTELNVHCLSVLPMVNLKE